MRHFDLRLGRQTVAVAEGVRIANPMGFYARRTLANMVERLTVTLDTMELLRHRAVVVPDILVEQPRIVATQLEDGSANYLFPVLSTGSDANPAKLGNLRITGGDAHVVLARLRADFNVAIETHDAADTSQVVADAKGAYAGQPIDARFVGGALLSLRDAVTPYQVNLKVANGPTHVTLVGSVRDPLQFAGTDLKLEMAGTNMELLLPLIGIAFPKTCSTGSKAMWIMPRARSISATLPDNSARATLRGISKSSLDQSVQSSPPMSRRVRWISPISAASSVLSPGE